MQGSIQKRNGYLFIVFKRVHLNEPKVSLTWYPLRVKAYHKLEHLIGRTVHPVSGGVYEDDYSRCYYLREGSETRAQYTDCKEVLPPRTRVRVRWLNGHWQKKLKRQGWINVEGLNIGQVIAN